MDDGKESLIKNVKSIYVLKKIYSFINKYLELLLINHNKNLQNKLNIDIEDYKKTSGKQIEGERNGKGKEYSLYTNALLFEGEYVKGEKNGEGKEYYENGKLQFEGEYLNGKRLNGKGMIVKEI